MILLALYAIAVWVGVAWWRRRWPGAVVLFGSQGPIWVFTLGAGFLAAEPGVAEKFGFLGTLAGYGRVIYFVSGFYAALIFAVALLIFVQPRKLLGHQCRRCRYDLRGIDSEVCPECGEALAHGQPLVEGAAAAS
ncbi:MAG: hypothetical protein ACKVZJ_08615 [Phycisphaerales bacterium]